MNCISFRTSSIASCAAALLGLSAASSYSAEAPAPRAPNGPCEGFYADGAQLVSGQVVRPWRASPKPTRGQTVVESSFKTCEVRVTDHAADDLKGFARNDYSRRQAFNVNGNKQLIYAYDGSWHLYRTRTSEHLAALPGVGGDAEPQWDAVQPNILYYLPTNGVGMKLFSLDIWTMQSTLVADFAARLKSRWPTANSAWTKSEGSPSADGRYWCFMVDDVRWGGLGFFTWDKQTDTILGMRSLTVRPDSVSMSPSGDYCVVTATDTVAYSRDLTTSKVVRKGAEHADLAFDANGEDAYVSIDYDDGYVFFTNLRTGLRTNLFPTYIDGTATAFHFSGKAFNKPGWFVMSTHGEYASYGVYKQQWLHRKVMAVQMAPNPRIYNLADTHVDYNGYWTEPQATTNRDMTRIAWTANWDVDTDMDVDTYAVQIPASAIH